MYSKLVALVSLLFCSLCLCDNIIQLRLQKVAFDISGGKFQHFEKEAGIKWTFVVRPKGLLDAEKSNMEYIWHLIPDCQVEDLEAVCIIKKIELVDQCDHHTSISAQFNRRLPLTIYERPSSGEARFTPFAGYFNCFITMRIQRIIQYDLQAQALSEAEKESEKYDAENVDADVAVEVKD